MKIKILIFFIQLLFIQFSYGQIVCPRDSISAVIEISINRIDTNYIYNYQINNSARSRQKVWLFRLILANNIKIKTILSPNHWKGSLGIRNNNTSVHWSTPNEIFNISHGDSLGGYAMITRYLPGLISCYLEGYAPPPTFEPGEAEDFIPGYDDLTPYGPGKIQKTIGPVPQLCEIGQIELCDSLISYIDQLFAFSWIKNDFYHEKYVQILYEIKAGLSSGDYFSARIKLNYLLSEAQKDHGVGINGSVYYLIKINAEHMIGQLPVSGNEYLTVKIEDSKGNPAIGGFLQYYENGWKSVEDHGDGSFTVITELSFVKLRMTYEHGIQEKSNVPVKENTCVFRTVSSNFRLKDSQQSLLDTGKVQYYSGGWYDLGTTKAGIARKELLPGNYKFRMIYGHASSEKYQDIGIDSTVVFRTIPVAVNLRDSRSAVLDAGIVKYYAGGWWDFGTTSNGVVSKELLPYNYKFRMTFAKASSEKYQDVGSNPVVLFQTVPVNVKLTNSQSVLMDTGKVQYYSGGWWDLGTTSNGVVSKELLPYNYKFRMTFANASNEKYHDVGSDPDVIFRTVQTRVELRNSQAALMDGGSVKYYSGGWWDFGATSNGAVSKELLPYNYKFRMTYANGSNEKYQDTGVNPVVVFPAVSAVVRVLNLQGNPVNNADVKYYSGGWYPFGVISGGTVARELLPYNYKFRATAGSKTSEKYQDLNANPVVDFTLDVP